MYIVHLSALFLVPCLFTSNYVRKMKQYVHSWFTNGNLFPDCLAFLEKLKKLNNQFRFPFSVFRFQEWEERTKDSVPTFYKDTVKKSNKTSRRPCHLLWINCFSRETKRYNIQHVLLKKGKTVTAYTNGTWPRHIQ